MGSRLNEGVDFYCHFHLPDPYMFRAKPNFRLQLISTTHLGQIKLTDTRPKAVAYGFKALD